MSRKEGLFAEEKAVIFLEEQGFFVKQRNFYSRFGEIDIIAVKDKVIHFIEVKSGKDEPIYNITPKKLSKIVKTSEFYLNKYKVDLDYTFDALIVKDKDIEIVENITFY